MDLDAHLKRCLKQSEQSTDHEAGCTAMIRAAIELGPPAVEQPTALGPFELLQQIGSGGMGEVWKAHHSRLNRTFAVKRLKPQILVNEELKQRFEREMQIAGNLDHPYIVRITHADEIDGVHFLAMDYVEGQTLSEKQRDLAGQGKQLTVPEVCRFGIEIAEAMQYAHDQGVVHRDLKPANVMLAEDGHVRVLDMGLARFAGADAQVTELTSQNQMMGTPDYMPPEQVGDSRKADERSDIYSLGATLYKLLVGRAPFATEANSTVSARIMAIASEVPEPVRSLRSDVSKQLSDLIDEMLAKQSLDRPESMSVVAARLSQLLPQVVPEPKPTRRAHPKTQAIRGARFWLTTSIAVIAAIAACIFGLQKITLKDPVYGTITITAPEDVKVSFTRVGVPADTREVTANGKQFKLNQGEWEITIDESVKGFKIDGPNRIRITDDRDRVIEIVSAEVPSPPEPASNDDEILARLNNIDWSTTTEPNETDDLARGLAVAHAKVPGVPNLQITTRVPTASEVVDVSPSGKFLVAAIPQENSLFHIIERETGRLVGAINHAPRCLGWNTDETELMVHNGWAEDVVVKVFSVDGRLKRDWRVAGALIPVSSRDGRQVLYYPRLDGFGIRKSDAFGVPATGFKAPEIDPAWKVVQGSFSRDGSRFALSFSKNEGRENRISVYAANGGDALWSVITESTAFEWHPTEDKIYCGLAIYSSDGSKQPGPEGLQPGSATRFSPDGSHIVSDAGDLVRTTGEYVRDLTPDGGGQLAFWKDNSTVVLLSRAYPGNYREVSLTGRVIREFTPPTPLPVRFMNARKDSQQHVSVVPATKFDRNGWIHFWNRDGSGTATALPGRGAWAGGHSIAIDPTNDRLAWHASYNVEKHWKVFGFDGNEITDFPSINATHDGLSWSPDGNQVAYYRGNDLQLVSGNGTRTIKVPEFETRPQRLSWISGTKLLDSRSIAGQHRYLDIAIDLETESITSDKDQASRLTMHNEVSPSGRYTLRFDAETQRLWYDEASEIRGQTKQVDITFPEGLSGAQGFLVRWAEDESKAVLYRNDRPNFSAWCYDFATRTLIKGPVSGGAQDPIWTGENIAICDPWNFHMMNATTGEATVIPLPSERSALVFPRSLSLNGDLNQRVVPVLLNKQQHGDPTEGVKSPVGGNICLVDTGAEELLWTGVPFSDGKRAVIEPSGRVRVLPDSDFDKYLTYVIRYECHYSSEHPRLIPLTRLQLASRMGLTEAEQVLQKVIDLGGTLLVGDELRPVTLADINDARDLPNVVDVTGIDLTNNLYLRQEDLTGLALLPDLQHISLSRLTWLKSDKDLAWLKDATKLRHLDLENTQVDDELSRALPLSLEVLNLSGTKVSEYLLGDLKSLPNLEDLSLGGIDVSKGAMEDFKKQRPNCKVLTREAGDSSEPNEADPVAGFDPQIDWTVPGDSPNPPNGLALKHAVVPGVPNIQVTTKTPIGAQLVSVSPKGTYAIFSTVNSKMRLIECETGRLVSVIRGRIDHSSLIGIHWLPDQSQVLVVSEHVGQVYSNLFDLQGRLLSSWQFGGSYGAVAANPQTTRLLYSNGSQPALMTDFEGNTIENFKVPKQPITNPIWSLDGSMFAVKDTKTKRIYVFDKDGDDPILDTEFVGQEDNRFTWHPSNRKFWTNNTLHALDGSSSPLPIRVEGYPQFQFSPDGNFLISQIGELFRNGELVEKLTHRNPYTARGDHVIWTEPGRITLFDGDRPGCFTEKTPNGRVIREVNRPTPIPVTSINSRRQKTDGLNEWVATYPAHKSIHKQSYLNFLDVDGCGKSVPFETLDHTGINSIQWNSKKEQVSWPYLSKLYTVDMAGKRIEKFEKLSGIHTASYSPDGAKLATLTHRDTDGKTVYSIVVESEGTTRSFDLRQNPKVADDRRRHWHLAWVSNSVVIAFHSDGERLIEHRVDPGAGEVQDDLDTPTQLSLLNQCSPSGQIEFHFDREQQELWYERNNGVGKVVVELDRTQKHEVFALAWNKDESRVAILSNLLDGHLIHNFETGKTVSCPTVGRLAWEFLSCDRIWRGDRLLLLWDREMAIINPDTGEVENLITFPSEGRLVHHTRSYFPRGQRYVGRSPYLDDETVLSNDNRYVFVGFEYGGNQREFNGGHFCLVDLQEAKVAWTGVLFNDGSRGIIEPNGKVRELPIDRFDDYLTYLVRYKGYFGVLDTPLTRQQVAARIAMSEHARALHEINDVGGRLSANDKPVTIDAKTDINSLTNASTKLQIDLVGNPYVNATSLARLKHVANAHQLSLSGFTLKSSDLDWLKELKNLKVLDLSNTWIDNDIFNQLPEGLEELNLANTKVGDFLLFDLPELKQLRLLDLSGTDVTREKVRQFQAKCPDCEVLCQKQEADVDAEPAIGEDNPKAPLKVGSSLKGLCNQPAREPYPIELKITKRNGNTFEGTTHYQFGSARIRGTIAGNTVEAVEYKRIDGTVITPTKWTAKLNGDKLSGRWYQGRFSSTFTLSAP